MNIGKRMTKKMKEERSEDNSDNLTLVLNVQMTIWISAGMAMMTITLRMKNHRMRMTNVKKESS